MKHRLALVLLVSATALSAEEVEKSAPARPGANPVVVMRTTFGDVEIELFEKEAPETVANFIGLAEGTKASTDAKTGDQEKRPFYDGMIFHRVIKDFMVQGGCPLGNGTGGPGFHFKDEINATGLGLDGMKAFDGRAPHPWLGIRSQQDFNAMILGTAARKLGVKTQAELERRKPEFEKAVLALSVKDVYEAMGYEYDDQIRSQPPSRGTIAMANSGPKTNGSQFFVNLVDNDYLSGKHTVFGRVVSGMDVVDRIGRVRTAGDRPVEDVKIISIRLRRASAPKAPEEPKAPAEPAEPEEPKVPAEPKEPAEPE